MKVVQILTVWYQSAHILDKTLPAWLQAVKGNSSVSYLIATNSPHEDTARKFLEPEDPDLASIELEYTSNVGFARACNDLARKATAPWILLLNPDVSLSSSDLEMIVSATAEMDDNLYEVGALSLITKGIKHVGVRFNALGFFTDCRFERRSTMIGPSGGALLIRRELFLTLGGLNDALFMWGEDVDFALTLLAKGISTKVLDTGLSHRGGHSLIRPEDLEQKAYLMARNRLLIIRGRYSTNLKVAQLPLVLTAMAGNLLLKKLPSGHFWHYLRGIAVGLTANLDDFFSPDTPRAKTLKGFSD